eukprot:CAMPEP_0206423276 /NCGR_PEP_ID=MMETSP0324_2-20121206/2593_1 /ASSEMBLY_ACC=CAM_ASM_000836 /TAXON_ID=2866 /ORGANISM="Crypthecodinium cohnii, Strain Seligo" /LENGTH=51 /DNA_ID=CAMNT_0053887823 /DNA_START=120 /DNA_END=275 /DNA_ORIENTATION=-
MAQASMRSALTKVTCGKLRSSPSHNAEVESEEWVTTSGAIDSCAGISRTGA